jgi:hypothetical protein
MLFIFLQRLWKNAQYIIWMQWYGGCFFTLLGSFIEHKLIINFSIADTNFKNQSFSVVQHWNRRSHAIWPHLYIIIIQYSNYYFFYKKIKIILLDTGNSNLGTNTNNKCWAYSHNSKKIKEKRNKMILIDDGHTFMNIHWELLISLRTSNYNRIE